MDVLSFFYLVSNSDDVGASFGPVVYRTRGMWSGCTYNGWGWGGAMDYMQVSRQKELHMTFLFASICTTTKTVFSSQDVCRHRFEIHMYM